MEGKRQSHSLVGSMIRITQNWTLLRALRLAVGLLLMAEALRSQNWFMTAAAEVFIIMPLLNIGCCNNGGCGIQADKVTAKPQKETDYEEVI